MIITIVLLLRAFSSIWCPETVQGQWGMKSKGWNIGEGETLRRRRPHWACGKALLDVGFNEPQEFIQIA
ncbi:hypothetical protein ACAG08_24295, partial [Escherichia coli]|uniref:hypothetical protein n=1 Tax=Escherichia coli TaxID=562 RepID=UPI003F9EFB23